VTGLCECGCGRVTSRHKQNDTARGFVKGQHARFVPGHNMKNASGKTYRVIHVPGRASNQMLEHRRIVEGVIGRPLNPRHEVHHVNGDRRDNRPSNLVVCEDRAYHKLLHARARVVAAGGNPNTQRVCSRCKRVLDVSHFGKRRGSQSGYQTACKPCGNEYRRAAKGLYIPAPNEHEEAA